MELGITSEQNMIVIYITAVTTAFNRPSATAAWSQLSKLTMVMNWIKYFWHQPNTLNLINVIFIICVQQF